MPAGTLIAIELAANKFIKAATNKKAAISNWVVGPRAVSMSAIDTEAKQA